jgi:hypothetical protein
VGLAACGDDPFAVEWSDAPDTVQIYSLARPELNLPSGFSFVPVPSARVIERPGVTGTWDIAIDTDVDQLVMLPPGALGITAAASIAVMGAINFEELREAPEDTLLYEKNSAVPLTDGMVYVVSTNRISTGSSSCVYYAKMQPVTIDVPAGTLKFRYVASPVCSSRDLVPPD